MSRKNKNKQAANNFKSLNPNISPKDCDIALIIDPEKGLLDILTSKNPYYKILIINSENGHYQMVAPGTESTFTDFDKLVKRYENKIKIESISNT